ncbi:hypothetical protein I7I48_07578 [Histoplasma ohiense]|nr:hypothetical protein I7I48_07578 [Histoplasma ohiense (nom. inval.)]
MLHDPSKYEANRFSVAHGYLRLASPVCPVFCKRTRLRTSELSQRTQNASYSIALSVVVFLHAYDFHCRLH